MIPIEIPWGFEELKTLDLSGNELAGPIPSELELLKNLGEFFFFSFDLFPFSSFYFVDLIR